MKDYNIIVLMLHYVSNDPIKWYVLVFMIYIQGHTPLSIAIKNDHQEIVSLLASKKAVAVVQVRMLYMLP